MMLNIDEVVTEVLSDQKAAAMNRPATPTTHKGRYESLLEIVSTEDIVCIPIAADKI